METIVESLDLKELKDKFNSNMQIIRNNAHKVISDDEGHAIVIQSTSLEDQFNDLLLRHKIAHPDKKESIEAELVAVSDQVAEFATMIESWS